MEYFEAVESMDCLLCPARNLLKNALPVLYRLLLVLLIPLPLSNGHAAATFHGTPENYLEMLKRLSAGDVLSLQAGVYRDGLALVNIRGDAAAPIIITGPQEGSAKFLGRPGGNTISIVNSSYIEIRNLELDGRGLPGDAVKAEGHAQWAHHITLEKLFIHGYGANQQTVGISTKCPAWGWIIRNNKILGAGTGIYLGNSDGSAPFVDGIIERNAIINTLGYNLQIKQQLPRPSLPGMPVERMTTIIRHNIFSKAENGSKGKFSRPNVLVGHWPLQGAGSSDTYLIYANLFYHNPDETLFQGEGNIVLYNNVFANPEGDAINIRPHRDYPRHVLIFHNTVLAGGQGISVVGASPAFRQNVVGNAVFADKPITADKQLANVTRPLQQAGAYLKNPLAPLGKAEWSPINGQLLMAVHTVPELHAYPDATLDFNGILRHVPIAGAYAAISFSR